MSRRVAPLSFLLWPVLVGCGAETPAAPPETAVTVPPEIPTVEARVRTLRFTDNKAAFNDAAGWLVAHPDAAHPVMLQVLAEQGPETKGILMVLPRMARADSVPAMAAVLEQGGELVTGAAGRGLGLHPDPTALAALRTGLASERGDTVRASLWGLGVRADPSTCADVRQAITDRSGTLRYHALKTAQKLGCLEDGELEGYRDDPHPDVRGLAGG